MALKVGSLYAEIDLDSSPFDRKLDQSGQRFEGFRNTVASGTRAAAQAFAVTTTAVGLLGVATFKAGVDYNRLQQNSRSALSTILGGAEAANRQMDKLDDFAQNSPFAREVFITAQQQLLGFGVEAERVVPILSAVGDAVAAVGGSNEQVSQITYALAQMQGQGRLTGRELNQLGQYGIDAASLIGAEMGKSGAEIRQMASRPGGIPVEDIWDPLVDGLVDAFEGASEGLRQQLDGATDRVRAARRDIGAILAEPFVDPMGGGILVDWTNDFATALRAVESQVKVLVPELTGRYEPALLNVGTAIREIGRWVDGLDMTQVNSQIDELSGYAPLIAGLGTAFFALGTQSLPFVGAINPIVAGMAALAVSSPEVRQALSDTASTLQPLLPQLGELGVKLADAAMIIITELGPAFGDLLIAGADLAVAWGALLIPSIMDLVEAGLPLVEVLADVLRWVADLPGPVQGAMLAFMAFHGPIGDVASALSGPLKAAFEGTRDYMATSRQIAEETGGQIGFIGASAGAAQAGVAGLGTALRTAFISNAIGLAIAGITVALAGFITSQAEAARHVDDLTRSLDQQTGSVTENTRESIYNRMEKDGIIEAASRAGIALRDLGEAAMDPTSDAAIRLREASRAASDELNRVHEESPGNTQALKAVTDSYEDLWTVSRYVTGEQSALADAQENLRQQQEFGLGATEAATSATEDYARAHRELRDELTEAEGAQLNAAEAALRLEDAHARATEAVERKHEADAEATRIQDDATASEQERSAASRDAERAHRDAERAVLELVRATERDIEAKARAGASNDELRAAAQRARDTFIDQRMALGDTRESAEALADSYGLIPNDVVTRIRAEDNATRTISQIRAEMDRLKDRTVTIRTHRIATGVDPGGPMNHVSTGGHIGTLMEGWGYADGGTPRRRINGYVMGAGTPTSDHIPAWLSPTEYVHRGAAVDRYGVGFMDAVNQGRFPLELAKGYAEGGSAAADIDRLSRRWIPAPAAQPAMPAMQHPQPAQPADPLQLTIVVQPQPGQSEEQIASAIANRFGFEMAG